MHDAKGRPLKVGDTVLIPAKVTFLNESTEDFCNVGVETSIGRRPDGLSEKFGAINTGVLLRHNPGDTNDFAEYQTPVEAPAENPGEDLPKAAQGDQP